jgi:hypothetical protein
MNLVRGLPTLALHGINSDSAGNYLRMEADSVRQDQNVCKLLKAVTISGSASLNPIYCKGQLFKKFKYENVIKMKNKPYPALLEGSYLFNEIKKMTPKSRETIPLICWTIRASPGPNLFALISQAREKLKHQIEKDKLQSKKFLRI